jgi:hypothetical protein
MARVTKAVATGNIPSSEPAEIAKVIDAYVKAHQTAELDERAACAEQLSDAELMRTAMGPLDAVTRYFAARGSSPVHAA